MYRNTATFSSGNVAPLGHLESPKSALDTDPELAELLSRKREQIDRQIEEFRAAKEREFTEFERSLRKQKQRRRRGSGSNSGQKDVRPGALSLLNLPAKQQQINGTTRQRADGDATSRASAPLSRPTTGIDKLSISGETLPPTPLKSKFPSSKPSGSTRPGSFSPSRKERRSEDALSPGEKSPLTPSTPNNEPLDAFAGLFIPTYLPLLDSRPSAQNPSPASEPVRHGSFSLPDSTYYPISPMRRPDRSHTEPAIPSTSLPSALRTASGTAVRKRKHVTFQLADSAIVEPSSSYEEMPSPSPKEEARLGASLEDGMSSDEDVPAPTHGLAMAVPSPDLRGRDKHVPGDLTGVIEGGGGAGGFFELDEELSSPRLDTAQPFMEEFEDDSSPVESRRGDGEADEHGEKPPQTYEYSGSVPIDIVRPSSSWVGSFGH